MQGLTERDANHKESDRKGAEDDHRLFGRWPQVIYAHAQRFRRVAMQQETRDEPDRKAQPRQGRGKLPAPDKPADENRDADDVEDGERSADPGAHGGFIASCAGTPAATCAAECLKVSLSLPAP